MIAHPHHSVPRGGGALLAAEPLSAPRANAGGAGLALQVDGPAGRSLEMPHPILPMHRHSIARDLQLMASRNATHADCNVAAEWQAHLDHRPYSVWPRHWMPLWPRPNGERLDDDWLEGERPEDYR